MRKLLSLARLIGRSRSQVSRRHARVRSTACAQIESLEARTLLSAVGGLTPGLPDAAELRTGPTEASGGGVDFGDVTVNPGAYHSSRILVQFRPDVETAGMPPADLPAGTALAGAYHVVPGLHEVELGPGIELGQALAAFQARADVVLAEPDYVIHAGATVTPNDPYFGSLWGMEKIQAPEAWGTTTGGPGTVVAVIDSGVDYTHPDLKANMWVNPGEIAGDGIDNDGNGYVDDLHGYDFVNGDPNPMDDNGHGTHVAGTIGAVGNNGTGVTGVNWSTRIMALKFLNSSGSGYLSHAIKAIDYAVANGARISNNSWGGAGYSTSLYTAIYMARSAGHLFVAAAGNNGSDNDSSPSYPASYDLDNIVAVAATDGKDNLASFSNYGATSVDLGAPGVNILSTVPGGYQYMNGTSMATPHVSGVAALVWNQNPKWTYTQVIDRLLATGDPVASLTGKTVTGRRLNAAAAIGTSTSNQAPVAGDDTASVPEDSYIDIAVLGNDSDPDGDALAISTFTQGVNGSVTDAGGGRLRYTPKANFFGTDTFSYTVSDGKGGTDTAKVAVTVTAVNDPPTANNDAYSVTQGTTTRLNVLGNDSILPDAGETLTITSVGAGSAGGTLAIVSGTAIDYTPKIGFTGTESFSYTISDGNGGTASATVSVTVEASAKSARFDFGTSTSPVESGYTRISEGTGYSTSRGYGWLSGSIVSRDRASGTYLTRDLNASADATFAVDLASGTYSVTVTLGDASYGHDQMGVYLEGVHVDTVTTSAGQFSTKTYVATVADGQLTVRLRDLGGNDPSFVIVGLEAVESSVVSVVPTAFDFGTSGSPVESGYTRISEGTGYSTSRGYGWLSGSIVSRDRASGTYLTRDLNASADATFAVDLASGTYDVTVTLGDASYGHDQMGVYLEGVHVDTVTTSAGQFSTKTYTTSVADGQLTVRLRDLGGSDPSFVINALKVAESTVVLQVPTAYDFGTSGSPVETGYTRISEGTGYSTSRGYGWLSGSIASRDRASGTSLTRDLNASADATFAIDLANGTYNVTVTLGDASYGHDQMGVYLEGVHVDTVTTSAGQFSKKTYSASVADGQLTLRLRDLGGSDPSFVINALEIAASISSLGDRDSLPADGLDELFASADDGLLI